MFYFIYLFIFVEELAGYGLIKDIHIIFILRFKIFNLKVGKIVKNI